MPNDILGESAPTLNSVEVSLYEVRKKLYPRSVSGIFSRWRIAFVIFTQILFYGLPWLSWNGRQAVLFDLISRKFYIFGLVLWPQDVIYLTLLLIISAFSLFLFTAIAGRLFCGYACPQTVYTQIFSWVERQIEGDRFARIRLDAESWLWNLRKIRIKSIRHFIWLVIAFWTGFTFIGYFTPIETLGAAILHLSLGPWQTFWLCFYSFMTWGNAGFLREQVCKYMCPYARFQSVMVDKDTFVVTYDKTRGDPRGSRSKSEDHKVKGLGDCVDCSICVQVCPTGIDIRDGLQYMCIGCGACIDACDQVMEKVDYPKGLIRYTSERAILEKLDSKKAKDYILRPRVLVYIGIMALLFIGFALSIYMRNPVRMDILRDRGALAREVDGSMIENIYRLQFMNSSEGSLLLNLRVEGIPNIQILDSQGNDISEIRVNASSNLLIPIKLRVPMDEFKAGIYPINLKVTGTEFGVHVTDKIRPIEEKSRFVIP